MTVSELSPDVQGGINWFILEQLYWLYFVDLNMCYETLVDHWNATNKNYRTKFS